MVAAILFGILLSAGKGEDITGFISLGCMLTFASIVIATFAGVLQRLVKGIVDIHYLKMI
ncbi:DUF2975 domain-containing protein [Neobacillus rhizosphaerae]|uniref:DUF2975 domain-containing protein n=1 Tax=Neobacillus rhizosphaerae TaxID=2880965 RepID=UPI003D2AFA33